MPLRKVKVLRLHSEGILLEYSVKGCVELHIGL